MTLFERLGGSDGLARLVSTLTERLAGDPVLAPLFENVDRDRLRLHRAHYLAAVLGGPEAYDGRGMREAHRPLAIDDALFDRFIDHVAVSARAAGTPSAAGEELVGFLTSLRPVIVSRARG